MTRTFINLRPPIDPEDWYLLVWDTLQNKWMRHDLNNQVRVETAVPKIMEEFMGRPHVHEIDDQFIDYGL